MSNFNPEVDYKFARTTRLNKVIFDQTLSNFGLTATFRAKLSILLITPAKKINQSEFKIELWGKNVVTCIDKCHRLFTIPVRAFL